jgi:hypothetical protein
MSIESIASMSFGNASDLGQLKKGIVLPYPRGMKKSSPASGKNHESESSDASRIATRYPNERIYGRTAAARFLGISRSALIRRERVGLYTPDASDENGFAFYTESYLRNVDKMIAKPIRGSRLTKLKDHGRVSPPERSNNIYYSAEEASLAFKGFREGERPSLMVERLKIHPSAVKELLRQWAELEDAIVVSVSELRKTLAELSESPTAEEVYRCLTDTIAAESRRALLCGTCRKRPQMPMCSECAMQAARKEAPLPPQEEDHKAD